jgi:phosphoglycolate phosphatase
MMIEAGAAGSAGTSGGAAGKRLLLFDIDGTLITSGGAGEQALRNGLRDKFGIQDDLHDIEIAGRTDEGIARSIFAKHGIPVTPENLGAFFDGYLHHLMQELPLRDGRLLPGIPELLKAIRPRPNLLVALLTGNFERGAKVKLSHFGVWEFFEFGAFADDHHDRNKLGHFARTRARERHGIEFAGTDIDVIGDTPHDISCGKVIGARTIGLATGMYTSAHLRDAGADIVFEDLSDTGAVMARLGWA